MRGQLFQLTFLIDLGGASSRGSATTRILESRKISKCQEGWQIFLKFSSIIFQIQLYVGFLPHVGYFEKSHSTELKEICELPDRSTQFLFQVKKLSSMCIQSDGHFSLYEIW